MLRGYMRTLVLVHLFYNPFSNTLHELREANSGANSNKMAQHWHATEKSYAFITDDPLTQLKDHKGQNEK